MRRQRPVRQRAVAQIFKDVCKYLAVTVNEVTAVLVLLDLQLHALKSSDEKGNTKKK